MGRLVLASRGIPGLAGLLADAGPHAVLVTTAANPLGEPGIADEVEAELSAACRSVTRLDLDAEPADAVAGADVVAVSGGDPFHLLAAARRTGFGAAASAALHRGAVYVGWSAGAMVAGPTLEPIRITSPFEPPDGFDLEGLGLTDVLVLPHHGRPGRAVKHAAACAFFPELDLRPLRDGEVVVIDP